jgi:hypothetical protein
MQSLAKYLMENTDYKSDFFYQKGEEEKEYEVVNNLLIKTGFSVERIASIVGVTEKFVEDVEVKLKYKEEVVKNLFVQTNFSIDKIASIACVTEEFVRKVKEGLK